MILVDCVYVNNGGGKVLLDQLVMEFNLSNLDVQFLFDERVEGLYDKEIFVNQPIYLKTGIASRWKFYNKYKFHFYKVLAFGNIPPPIKLNAIVYTYLHNVLYLEKDNFLNFHNNLFLKVKSYYLKYLKKNTNYWIVQTNLVKFKLAQKWHLSLDNIYVIPFYNEKVYKDLTRTKMLQNKDKFVLKYLYVSNGEKYKNHLRLFKAFEKFSLRNKKVELIVTLSESYSSLINEIDDYNKRGISITNLGLIPKSEINSVYSSVDVILFPSIFESFGLGLIEAAQFGLPVIATDSDYVEEVIIPSKSFLAENIDSIFFALEYSYNNKLQPSQLVVKNQIKDLISIFKS